MTLLGDLHLTDDDARALVAEGKPDEALRRLERAFAADPSSVGVLCDLGALSLSLARRRDGAERTALLSRAQKAFRALLLQRLDQGATLGKADVFYHLAEIGHFEGDDAKASQMLDRALQIDARHPRARSLSAELAPARPPASVEREGAPLWLIVAMIGAVALIALALSLAFRS